MSEPAAMMGGVPMHRLKLVLVEPEIPQNTGNIARLCSATGAALHLVRPLGFFLSDRHFKRAAMDYLRDVSITVHDDLAALLQTIGREPIFLTSGRCGQPHWSAEYPFDAWLFFGRESAGLPEALLQTHRDRVYRIPMLGETRGLNLATAAGIFLYEALRQLRCHVP